MSAHVNELQHSQSTWQPDRTRTERMSDIMHICTNMIQSHVSFFICISLSAAGGFSYTSTNVVPSNVACATLFWTFTLYAPVSLYHGPCLILPKSAEPIWCVQKLLVNSTTRQNKEAPQLNMWLHGKRLSCYCESLSYKHHRYLQKVFSFSFTLFQLRLSLASICRTSRLSQSMYANVCIRRAWNTRRVSGVYSKACDIKRHDAVTDHRLTYILLPETSAGQDTEQRH